MYSSDPKSQINYKNSDKTEKQYDSRLIFRYIFNAGTGTIKSLSKYQTIVIISKYKTKYSKQIDVYKQVFWFKDFLPQFQIKKISSFQFVPIYKNNQRYYAGQKNLLFNN